MKQLSRRAFHACAISPHAGPFGPGSRPASVTAALAKLLLNVIATVSAALCLAVVVLGGRSFRALTAFRCWNDTAAQGVVFTGGHVLFWRQPQLDNPGPAGPLRFEPTTIRPPTDVAAYEGPGIKQFLGFGFGWGDDRTIYPVRQLLLPAWALALVLAVPPAFALWHWRRRRNPRPGHCVVCGYDLRATPEGPEKGGALLDRCPECGFDAFVPSPGPPEQG